jgi:hypothetical protein
VALSSPTLQERGEKRRGRKRRERGGKQRTRSRRRRPSAPGEGEDAGLPLLHHGTALHDFTGTRHQLTLHRYPFAIATYGELTASPRSPPVVLGMVPPHLFTIEDHLGKSRDPHTLITRSRTHDVRTRWSGRATGARKWPQHADAQRVVAMVRPRHGEVLFLM